MDSTKAYGAFSPDSTSGRRTSSLLFERFYRHTSAEGYFTCNDVAAGSSPAILPKGGV
jgi:hypothetical protein